MGNFDLILKETAPKDQIFWLVFFAGGWYSLVLFWWQSQDIRISGLVLHIQSLISSQQNQIDDSLGHYHQCIHHAGTIAFVILLRRSLAGWVCWLLIEGRWRWGHLLLSVIQLYVLTNLDNLLLLAFVWVWVLLQGTFCPWLSRIFYCQAICQCDHWQLDHQ